MDKLLLVIIPKKAAVPRSVIEMVVSVFSDLGVLMIGSVVLPVLFDKGSPAVIISGSVAALVLWLVAGTLSWRYL